MSIASRLGPWLLGTVREGASRNMGVTAVAQTATVAFGVVTTSPTAQLLFTLPAGAKILRIGVEHTTAYSGGTISGINATIGTSGTANLYYTTTALGTSAGKVAQATLDAQMQVSATNNIGTSDVPVYGTFTAGTGNPTAGASVITVEYLVRNSDGTYGANY